jgi:chromosomal replication initiator protein
MTSDAWDLAKCEIMEAVGRHNYTHWIEPLKFGGIEDGVLRLASPTDFIGRWVVQNYSDAILRHVNERGIDARRIVCATSGASRAAPSAASRAARAVPAAGPSPFALEGPSAEPAAAESGGGLDPRHSFDSFVVGKPNELAHAACRRVSAGESVTFNPLFLYGGVGLGKTHLMQATAQELRRRRPELNVVFLSAEQFMYRFVQALRSRDTMAFKELYRSVDVLLVDDVQFIAGKDSTQEEFFHTFNALVDGGRQVVLSADRSPSEMTDLALPERIISRFQSGLVVDLHPADFELRLGVLQHRVASAQAADPSFQVEAGVLEFLPGRISTSIRVLEGAINRLHAFAQFRGGELSLAQAQDALADLLRCSEKKLTIEEIMKRTCEHYNLRMSDMTSARRTRSVARPRQMAMYLAKKLTPRSYPEIGRRFGGKDHTTVLYAVRKIEELIGRDPQIAEDAVILQRRLEA